MPRQRPSFAAIFDILRNLRVANKIHNFTFLSTDAKMEKADRPGGGRTLRTASHWQNRPTSVVQASSARQSRAVIVASEGNQTRLKRE
jgi:hypothetical protein